MYQTIDERVDVAGVYTQGKFLPKKFHWRGATFTIQSVESTHNWKDGSVQKRRFAVMAEKKLYVLEFNRDTETWNVIQVWVE